MDSMKIVHKFSWKGTRLSYTQLIVNIISVITGFSTFLPLGYIQKYLSNHCLLYADLKVSTTTVDSEMELKVDLQTSVWGSTSDCNLSTFAPVVAAIHAFVWCWFFMLMKKEMKEEHSEYKLLLPCLFSHCIMFLIMLVSSCITSVGGSRFCSSLEKALNSKFTCSEAFEMSWDIYSSKKKHNVYGFLSIATASVWVMTVTILIQSLLSVHKLHQWLTEQEMDKNSRIKKANRTIALTSKQRHIVI